MTATHRSERRTTSSPNSRACCIETAEFLAEHDVDLDDLEESSGLEFVALQASAAEALLIDEETRRRYVRLATGVRNAFKALLPDPEAQARTRRVAVIRSLAKKLAAASDPPDISNVMDSVSDLLDRSVGAEEYLIRSGGDADPLIDLSQIDFEELAGRFANNKRTAARKMQQDLEARLERAVRANPTRLELAEKFRRLIEEYNAGTHNIEEMLRRLKALSDELSEEETRSVREELTEAELAIFDLLTKPEPDLNDKERDQVKGAARKLLETVTEKLVLDWRKRNQTKAVVQVTVGQTLDQELPDIYTPELFDQKVAVVFRPHLLELLRRRLKRVRRTRNAGLARSGCHAPRNARGRRRRRARQGRAGPEYFAQLMALLFGASAVWSIDTVDLLAAEGEEGRHIKFKQTARWNVREQRKDKTMEEVIAKTVAGFLNGEGGTLLIGVNDNGEPVGLDADYQLVKPPDRDGYVNWLDTMLQNSLGHAGAHRVRIRFDIVSGYDVCRLDVPASSKPIWATKGDEMVLYERRNNSTRAVPADELDQFKVARFGLT